MRDINQGLRYEDKNEIAVVKCGTTKGDFIMELHKQWSPNGYDKAVSLFEQGFYDHSHFYRVVHGFLVQFGISYNTDKELQTFAHKTIPDDPQLKPPIPFAPGIISYAGKGSNSRTSQLFISYGHSNSLGTQKWETPIGVVIEGYESVIEKLHSYGDMPPWGKGPDQKKIHNDRSYIDEHFPLTDSFQTCVVQRIRSHTIGNEDGNISMAVARSSSKSRDERRDMNHNLQEQFELHREMVAKRHSHMFNGSVHSKHPHRKNKPSNNFTVDKQIVLAAAITVVMIWICTRPYMAKRSKRQMKRFD